MNLQEFLDKEQRKEIRREKSGSFNSLREYFKMKNFEISVVNDKYHIRRDSECISLNDFFSKVISQNVLKIHESIVEYYSEYNKFLDDLPLFIVRRHGTHSGPEGGQRRRRGWLVKFNNAWIVYADNFISRHMFEYNYFSDSLNPQELARIILNKKFPYSSGGGRLEIKNRIFPSLTHLTSKSNLYLSHLFDLNNGIYEINGTKKTAKDFLKSNEGKFGYGNSSDWNMPIQCHLGMNKNFKHFNEELTEDELKFLKTYNIRMLSPLNYFPFPKNKFLNDPKINGESPEIRRLYKAYIESKFDDESIYEVFK